MVSIFATRPRFLYVARAGERLCKVGISINPQQRVLNVDWVNKRGKMTRMPTPERPRLVWQKLIAARYAKATELCITHRLQNYCDGMGREWFSLSAKQVLTEIKKILKQKPRCTWSQAQAFVMNTRPLRRTTANENHRATNAGIAATTNQGVLGHDYTD